MPHASRCVKLSRSFACLIRIASNYHIGISECPPIHSSWDMHACTCFPFLVRASPSNQFYCVGILIHDCSLHAPDVIRSIYSVHFLIRKALLYLLCNLSIERYVAAFRVLHKRRLIILIAKQRLGVILPILAHQ